MSRCASGRAAFVVQSSVTNDAARVAVVVLYGALTVARLPARHTHRNSESPLRVVRCIFKVFNQVILMPESHDVGVARSFLAIAALFEMFAISSTVEIFHHSLGLAEKNANAQKYTTLLGQRNRFACLPAQLQRFFLKSAVQLVLPVLRVIALYQSAAHLIERQALQTVVQLSPQHVK